MIDKIINKLANGEESVFEKIASNPVFLKSVATAMNASHLSKAMIDNYLNSAWQNLQLPTRQEHEALQSRVAELEIKLEQMQIQIDKLCEPSSD